MIWEYYECAKGQATMATRSEKEYAEDAKQ